jgi:hypothetical protein
MDHHGPTHSPPSTNLVLLRPQSQTLTPPTSEASGDDGFPHDEVADEPEDLPRPRLPKLTVVPSIPEIHLDQDLHVILGLAMKALSNDPRLFSKGDQLVRVVGDGDQARLLPMCTAKLREELSVRARWVADDYVHPPSSVASALVRRGSWSHIRELRAMTTFPVLSPEGELRTQDGYDAGTKTFFSGGCTVNVPEQPTLDEAKAACAHLLDLVSEFPFAGEAHRTAWLAALLTPLSRFMHEGNVPLVVVQANMPGTGKSTLAQLIATIVTGSSVPVMACEKNEPNRKEILSKLRASPPIALIDNVATRFGGPNMATLVTGRSFEDRSLGHLKTLSAPNDTTWMITGNRISLAPDMGRRCLHVRLQSDVERPHLRDGFRHPNLLAHAREHRGELLSAALTILKAYAVAGMPDVGLPSFGSFEEWSRIVRGAVVWCDLLDPALTREELEDDAEEGVSEHARLVEGWHQLQMAMGRDDGMTVKEALDHLEREPSAAPLLRDALDGMRRGSRSPEPLVIARRLREAKDRNVDGKVLRSGGNPKEALRWTVSDVP